MILSIIYNVLIEFLPELLPKGRRLLEIIAITVNGFAKADRGKVFRKAFGIGAVVESELIACLDILDGV